MARRGVTNEYNLATLNPQLASEWHTIKNSLTPSDVTPGSGLNVWWRCKRGHEWQSTIVNRSKGRGCPYCAGKLASDSYNLAILHQAIAKEWHPRNSLRPYEVTPNSHQRVSWVCKKGHTWEAVISSRVSGSGCPFCAGKLATPSKNLETDYPHIAAQWHLTKNGDKCPSDYLPKSNKKVWWMCEKGHSWQSTVYNRVRGDRCPYCSGKIPSENHNLIALYPEVASTWHPTKNSLKPNEVTPKSGKKYWWRCDQNHEWQATVANRVAGYGCPYCSGRLASPTNNLAVRFPEIAKQWHPTKNVGFPSEYLPYGHQKVWWLCDRGHEYQAVIGNRASGYGCPKCWREEMGEVLREAWKNRNGTLADALPELAKQWHPTKNKLTPHDVAPKSNRKVWWICSRGHEYQATVSNRNMGRGCPFCHPQTSRVELLIFSELKWLFSDALWREKINGLECDVFLPKYKTAIEVDGYLWHFDRESQDREKVKRLEESGVKVLRIRYEKLGKLNESDVLIIDGDEPFNTIRRVISGLLQFLTLNNSDTEKINQYLEGNILQNTTEYNRLVSMIPGPPPEKSFAKLHPVIASQWNMERNAPLKPEMFGPRSEIKVWWICSKGHVWQSTISNRVIGRGCPYCSHRVRTQ